MFNMYKNYINLFYFNVKSLTVHSRIQTLKYK